MKKILILIWLLSCVQLVSFSQDQLLIDSLQQKLARFYAEKKGQGKTGVSLEDSTATDILYSISIAYWGNDPQKAMDFAERTLAVSEKIGYRKGIGNAYNGMGAIYKDKGDLIVALDYFKKSLKIRQEIGDKRGIVGASGNIGIIAEIQGNYPEALKNYFGCLKAMEEIGNRLGIAQSYQNIGMIYRKQLNYNVALKNYKQALKIQQELGNETGIAAIYNNIGVVYDAIGNYPEALSNYKAAFRINEKISDKEGIANSYSNIGVIYEKKGNLEEALKNHFTSLRLKREIGSKGGIIASYINLGGIYLKQKKYADASRYIYDALALSKEIGSLDDIKDSYQSLVRVESMRGNYKLAIEHMRLYYSYRDSLLNNENTKKIVQQQMQYDFDKKESLSRAEQERKDSLALKEIQKQKLVRNGFVGGFAVVLLFAAVFFRQRNKISKEKKISEAEKERSEELLLNILPAEVAEELKQTGQCQPKTFNMVTVMFTDFKGFTLVSEKVSAELLVHEINYCFSAFDTILQKYKIEKIKTVGDAYMCASGLPTLNSSHAFDVVSAALEMRDFILARKKEKELEGKGEIAFEMRIGIHTGPVVAGIVGIKKFSYDIWGDTVNLAARMEQNCEAGHVNISDGTYEMVKDTFKCVYRGKIDAKNKGMIDMYFVEGQHPTL